MLTYQRKQWKTWGNGSTEEMGKEMNKSKERIQAAALISNKSQNNITLRSEIHTTAKTH